MAFFDELTFHAQAGKGGDGVVRWRHEKFIAKGGPNGGNGGGGGNVYVRGIRNIHILSKYRHEKEFAAENGGDGQGGSRQGKYGADLVIDLPIGSIITHTETGAQYTLLEVGQKELILKGGKGGFGNEHFKSSINTTPTKSTRGESGEAGTFHIELELFADIGLVGFPNAGKSSLLNTLTNAEAKIGDYQFTTLEPNLGDFYGYVIADIPGIIEGASTGKGLGVKFLKHIKRTKKILHLVSLEDSDTVFKRYQTIRSELQSFGFDLVEKDEIILLTKTDLVDAKTLNTIVDQFKKDHTHVYTMSLYDDAQIEIFKKELSHILQDMSLDKNLLKQILIDEGFTHVYEWKDAPHTFYEAHKHKGKVSLFVINGSVTFSGGIEKTVSQGERFDVPVEVEHTAQVGNLGCEYIVGEEIEGDS